MQLVAYYDDLEVCNPLGAAAKHHEVGAFFYFLANIHPQYCSSLNVSHLFAVAKSSDIKSHGVDAVLKPFVEDLKKLSQEGITVTIKSHEYTFKGNMVVFLADNLACHTIGGFKESMGFAFRFCRKCMTTKEQSQIYFTSSSFKMHNPEEHIQQCMLLLGPLKEPYSTTFGIRRNSILNEVPNFSVTTGLTHDIIHDLFEGVVPLELKLLL